jgi:hypothetical protein
LSVFPIFFMILFFSGGKNYGSAHSPKRHCY